MIKKIALFFLGLSVGFYSCRAPSKKNITIRGSDTMVLIGQRWAEKYMKKFPKQIIQVNGGGSGTGFAALINGMTDICQASRPIKESEKQSIKKKFNRDVKEIPVAKDGIAVYVHENNPIKDLALEDLKNIFSGKLTNWKELNGPDEPIIVYGRENSSGTYEFFKEHVLEGNDFAAEVQALPGTASIVSAIKNDTKAIGYGGVAYTKNVKLVPIKKSKKESSVALIPSKETIADGTYPITRRLFFYMNRNPNPKEEAFIEWVLSDEGQSIAIKEGYFPIHTNKPTQ